MRILCLSKGGNRLIIRILSVVDARFAVDVELFFDSVLEVVQSE